MSLNPVVKQPEVWYGFLLGKLWRTALLLADGPPDRGRGHLRGDYRRRTGNEKQAGGNTDWNEKFRRFTADRSNFCDTIILLSSGPYSSVPAEQAGMTAREWAEKSVAIRMYHELTHFICRKLYPEKKDEIRDEIYADCIGLIAAFGRYDPQLAKTFLGIEAETYRKGGRLEHYAPQCTEEDIRTALQWIREAEERVARSWQPDREGTRTEEAHDRAVFELIRKIY